MITQVQTLRLPLMIPDTSFAWGDVRPLEMYGTDVPIVAMFNTPAIVTVLLERVFTGRPVEARINWTSANGRRHLTVVFGVHDPAGIQFSGEETFVLMSQTGGRLRHDQSYRSIFFFAEAELGKVAERMFMTEFRRCGHFSIVLGYGNPAQRPPTAYVYAFSDFHVRTGEYTQVPLKDFAEQILGRLSALAGE